MKSPPDDSLIVCNDITDTSDTVAIDSTNKKGKYK